MNEHWGKNLFRALLLTVILVAGVVGIAAYNRPKPPPPPVEVTWEDVGSARLTVRILNMTDHPYQNLTVSRLGTEEELGGGWCCHGADWVRTAAPTAPRINRPDNPPMLPAHGEASFYFLPPPSHFPPRLLIVGDGAELDYREGD